jgi:hypothetical protein
MIEDIAKKIKSIPRNELNVNKVEEILQISFDREKKEFKTKVMLILIDCMNQEKSISEAIVTINNLENGK